MWPDRGSAQTCNGSSKNARAIARATTGQSSTVILRMPWCRPRQSRTLQVWRRDRRLSRRADGELRFDPLTGEWVNIVGHRQARPNLPSEGCPFCVGGLEAPDPYDVRWFANRWPALAPGPPIDVADTSGPKPAAGAGEVVLFSPEHDESLATLPVAQVRKVVDLWAERTERAARATRDRVRAGVREPRS